MTNYEKHKDQLIEMLADNIGVDKYTNEPSLCDDLDCDICINPECSVAYMRAWLNEEYKQPKTMTVAELSRALQFITNQNMEIKSLKIINGEVLINE